MSSANPLPGLGPWQQAEAELERLVAFASGTPAEHALRHLKEIGRHFAALARGEDVAAAYARLLAQPPVPASNASDEDPAAVLRWQSATGAIARFGTMAAQDAAARFARALEAEAPDAPPIRSLRALFDLWVECGEAAWAEVARRDDYAEAQAELLHALAGFRRGPASK